MYDIYKLDRSLERQVYYTLLLTWVAMVTVDFVAKRVILLWAHAKYVFDVLTSRSAKALYLMMTLVGIFGFLTWTKAWTIFAYPVEMSQAFPEPMNLLITSLMVLCFSLIGLYSGVHIKVHRYVYFANGGVALVGAIGLHAAMIPIAFG